ncbi:hypothetical protein ACIOWM_36675 [Streptomyces anulatus]
MDYSELMEADLAKLGVAVADWKKMAAQLKRLAADARDGLRAKSDKARWQGINAEVTRGFVGKTAKECDDLHKEARSILAVLDDANTELLRIQKNARELTAAARKDGYVVTGGKGGTVKVEEAMCTVEGPDQKKLDTMRWYADALAGLVSHADEVDASAVRALRASHGGDPVNAGHATYTSLDEDMLPRALKLAELGGDANERQRQELQRVWQSLSPESRASLWADNRNDLLAAGLLTPQVKRTSADAGAGPFDVRSPGAGDLWTQVQANGMSNVGDFSGKPDAARHMDHYLRGIGSTLDLDVDRMLTDDQNLRDVTSGVRTHEQEGWRRQAIKAFEESGGKPVAIPVETKGQGYTHVDGGDRNWYLAVGSAMTNTTGVVTAVPGADGKPEVSIDYQVNVWDRYNWDPGKATPIGPTTVTDADMARLHTTGLAREFDMRGSSSVQQHDLGSGDAWLGPADPGRDGTRTDIGRNGDAR